jgi:hypothetical protein
MRTLFAVALFATGALVVVAADVKTFESKDGKFSVKFPGTPISGEKTAGGLTLHIFTADFDKGKGGYLVYYVDLPPAVLKAPQPEQVLASGEKGLVDNFKAKITKSGPTTFGPKKYPAREILAEQKAIVPGQPDWHMRATIVLVGPRLYQVCVFGPNEFVTGKDADDFIKSFEITSSGKE